MSTTASRPAAERAGAGSAATTAVGAAPRPTVRFDADRMAALETRMWKAYYRRQPLRLFGLLVLALREQAGATWPRSVAAAVLLTRAAVGFGRAVDRYDRFLPDIERGYRLLGLGAHADVAEVARWELRWWVVRREVGPRSAAASAKAIGQLYATWYGVPVEGVAEAARLRGLAAQVRDVGAAADPDGPEGPGREYWPVVGRLLRESYRELARAVGA